MESGTYTNNCSDWAIWPDSSRVKGRKGGKTSRASVNSMNFCAMREEWTDAENILEMSWRVVSICSESKGPLAVFCANIPSLMCRHRRFRTRVQTAALCTWNDFFIGNKHLCLYGEPTNAQLINNLLYSSLLHCIPVHTGTEQQHQQTHCIPVQNSSTNRHTA